MSMAEAPALDRTTDNSLEQPTEAAAPLDPITAALVADKRAGLRQAVKARWLALAVIAPFLVYLNPTLSVLYYEAMLVGFALIGWVQVKAGRLGKSRLELALIFCDLALMTIVLVVPNPFMSHALPVAMQYEFGSFLYFFVFLASATMGAR